MFEFWSPSRFERLAEQGKVLLPDIPLKSQQGLPLSADIMSGYAHTVGTSQAIVLQLFTYLEACDTRWSAALLPNPATCDGPLAPSLAQTDLSSSLPHLDGIDAYEEDVRNKCETQRQAIRVYEALMAPSINFGVSNRHIPSARTEDDDGSFDRVISASDRADEKAEMTSMGHSSTSSIGSVMASRRSRFGCQDVFDQIISI